MPPVPEAIAYCHSCGSPMNVSAVAPFSNVECPACGKHTRVKREFGPYTLVSRHAVGGMSMVFVAHDNTLDREVALKILSEDFSADEKRISAFEEEARITASFSHPHVVRVLTTGRAFDRFYIAMELVPGGHFEHQIKEQGKIPELDMLPLAIEVAQGLKAAHAAGLIHRDVKPGNILLDAEGHAKLVDFGLALVTQGGKAQAAEIWATPYYVPPETIEGYEEDFRSDIYAFGATLYHALAGVPSCGEQTMATDLLRAAKQNITPLGMVEPSVSIETTRIVDRAMAYNPQDRYDSYDELISRLESALKRLRTGVGAESAGVISNRRAKSKREEILTMAVAGVVLMCAVTAGIWWVVRKDPENGTKALPQASTVIPTPEDGENVPADEVTAIAKSYREARAAIEARDYEKATAGFSELLANPKVQEPTRSWAGVEAVVSAYLGGDSALARKNAVLVSDHIKSLPDTATRPDECLIQVLDSQDGLVPVSLEAAKASNSKASSLMSMLIGSLKNWEQGIQDKYVESFKDISSASLSQDERWLSIYQNVAKEYEEDALLMEDPVFSEMPADVEACVQSVAKLDEIHAKLRTRGRARFNVRAWQLDLTRQAKLISGPKAAAPDPEPEATVDPEPEANVDPDSDNVFGSTLNPAKSTPEFPGSENPADTGVPTSRPVLADVMEKLSSLAADCQFEEGVAYLETLPANPQGATRESLKRVTAASAELLKELETDLGNEPVDGDFSTKSGPVKRISATGSGKLTVIGPDGVTTECGWADISPDTVISLHRIFVKNPMDDGKRLLRHERAICFDWLAGNRQRAVTAAALLAQGNTAFKQRWDRISEGLPL